MSNSGKRKRNKSFLVLGISGKIGSGKSTLSNALKSLLESRGWMVFERNFADKLKELVAFHFGIDVALCYTQEGKNTPLLPIDRTEYTRTFPAKLKALVAFHFGFDVALFDAELPTFLSSRYGDNMSIDEMLGLWKAIHLEEFGQDTMTVGQALQKWGTALRNVDQELWIKSVADYVEQNRATAAAADSKKILVIVPDTRFPNEADWIRDEMSGITVRLNGDPGEVAKNSRRDLQHVSETALDDYQGFHLVLDTNTLGVEQCAERVLRTVVSY